MESLRWRRLEPPGRPETDRARPVVRRRSTATRSGCRLGPGIAVAAAAVAVVAGTGALLGLPIGAGSRIVGEPGQGVEALTALAPDVAGRPWLVRRGDDRWTWGRAGQRERGVLPEDETGLAVGGRWLASGLMAPDRTRLRVRDLETGGVVLETQLDFQVAAAAIAGDRLLATGYAGGFAGADGGVVAVDLPDGVVHTLAAAGPFPARLGASPRKGDVHVSPGGSLAAVNTCGSKGCDTLVVDLATLTTTMPQRGEAGFLRSITDRLLVLTDADGAWIRGVDARSGKRAFAIAGESLMEPASMADGRVIANVGGGAAGWRIAAIGEDGRLAPITGAARAPGPWVWPAVSSPTIAVLGDLPFAAALTDPSGARNTLVRGADLRDLGTLVVQPAE